MGRLSFHLQWQIQSVLPSFFSRHAFFNHSLAFRQIQPNMVVNITEKKKKNSWLFLFSVLMMIAFFGFSFLRVPSRMHIGTVAIDLHKTYIRCHKNTENCSIFKLLLWSGWFALHIRFTHTHTHKKHLRCDLLTFYGHNFMWRRRQRHLHRAFFNCPDSLSVSFLTRITPSRTNFIAFYFQQYSGVFYSCAWMFALIFL